MAGGKPFAVRVAIPVRERGVLLEIGTTFMNIYMDFSKPDGRKGDSGPTNGTNGIPARRCASV